MNIRKIRNTAIVAAFASLAIAGTAQARTGTIMAQNSTGQTLSISASLTHGKFLSLQSSVAPGATAVIEFKTEKCLYTTVSTITLTRPDGRRTVLTNKMDANVDWMTTKARTYGANNGISGLGWNQVSVLWELTNSGTDVVTELGSDAYA